MISLKYLTSFTKLLSKVVDRHAPLTNVTKEEIPLLLKSWINKEIKNLTYKRDRLYRKYYIRKNETEK